MPRVVAASSREAKARLYKTTCFYQSNIAAYPADLVSRGLGYPPELFHQLVDFARPQVKAFDASKEFTSAFAGRQPVPLLPE